MYSFSEVSERRFWGILALLTVGIVFGTSIHWIYIHPYPVGWDEAEYINLAQNDISSFRQRGIHGLVKSLLTLGTGRPPGNRLLVLPLTLLLGSSPVILRLVSLISLGISLLFVYLTGKQIAGPSAGAFATILLSTNSLIISTSKFFGTECGLYLAISAMLFFLFRELSGHGVSSWQWIGLGLALGLGAWAKASFVLVSGPIVLLTFILSSSKLIANPSPRFLIKATALGVALASPWWLLNFRDALGYAKYASNYTRHSLGPPSLETYAKWLGVFIRPTVGLALSILVVSLLLTILSRNLTGQGTGMDPMQVTAVWICIAGTLPLLIAQMIGVNHNMRLISPSFIPSAVALSVMATKTHWTRVRLLAISASMLLCFHLFVVVSGSNSACFHPSSWTATSTTKGDTIYLGLPEQWDWEKLRQFCKAHQIETPSIVFLGNGWAFNPPQIAYPWIKANETVKVQWLWRYEQGEINWQKIMDRINSSDVVLTAPKYIGDPADKQDFDNQHNAELVRRLETASQFEKPIQVKMGRCDPVEVFVFLHKRVEGKQ